MRIANEIRAKIQAIKAENPNISLAECYGLLEQNEYGLYRSASIRIDSAPGSVTTKPSGQDTSMKSWYADILKEISTPEAAKRFLTKPRASLVQADEYDDEFYEQED